MSRSPSRDEARAAPRRTFRGRQTGVCWQRQLRDRYADEGVPAGVPHLEVGRARVRAISREAASRVIYRYEWLGTMATSTFHFGIFFGPYLAGVTCVAIGSGTAGPYVADFYAVAKDELATLVRGACVHWAPPGANSRLVSWTVRLLRAASPRTRVLVAYSDPDAGEVGTIYQACGWTYVGQNVPSHLQYVSPEGAIRNQRVIGSWAKARGLSFSEGCRLYEEHGWKPQRPSAKGRYATRVRRRDREVEARLAELSRPYPKRDSASEALRGGAPVDQAGGGGSTPTPTLPAGGPGGKA